MSKIYVYWIRYEEHSCPKTQGYVGVTVEPERRFRYHSGKHNNNPILYRAIRKGAVMEILSEFDDRECALNEEMNLRPSARIGWNIIAGGIDPPVQTGNKFSGMKGKKHSKETLELMSEQRRGIPWWNNGVIQKRSDTCPKGFVKGRLPYKQYNLSEDGKKNLGKWGIKIFTPFGKYDTIKQASIELGYSYNKINLRLNSDKYPEWGYL